MTAMFPESGAPATQAHNSLLDPNTVNCKELWYSTVRCEPRFDPAAANAVLSELINLVNCAGLPYDCSKLNNLCEAIQHMIQSGSFDCLTLTGGPNDYAGNLTPPLIAYPTSCCMMLKVIPNVGNAGPVRISLNNLDFVPVLRNDGQQLAAGDLIAGVPFLVIYCGGVFYHIGWCPSQIPPPYVPPVVITQVDLWVRPDGNDNNDGSANDPAAAFRTVQGAWSAAIGRYETNPLSVLHFRLGTPGTYEGWSIGPFGGSVIISGDTNNRNAYRFSSWDGGDGWRYTIGGGGLASLNMRGICPMQDYGGARSFRICSFGNSSNVNFDNCDIEVTTANTGCELVHLESGARGGFTGIMNINGNGASSGALITTFSGALGFSTSTSGGTLNANNINFGQMGLLATQLSVMDFSYVTLNSPGCTGVRYVVEQNSIMRMRGNNSPGSSPGIQQTGGQYIGN